MTTYTVCVFHQEKPANLTPYTALAQASSKLGPFFSLKAAQKAALPLEDVGFEVAIVIEQ